MVIIGRGGQIVLRGQPDVLHVRLIAPLEVRIQRHAERAGLSLEAAREAVLKRDAASVDFVRRYYRVDPADSSLYDLVCNTARLTAADAAGLIIDALACLEG